MPKSPNPSFASEALQKAVSDARPILEGVEEAWNQVSADIKALEAYLRSLDLKHPFRFPLGKSFTSEDPFVAHHLEDGGAASGTIVEGALVWGPNGSDSFRLLREDSRWDGGVDVDAGGGPYFWDDSTLRRDAKPLIESKFETRKRLYPRLPDFVAALAKHFDVMGQKPPFDDLPMDDGPPPF